MDHVQLRAVLIDAQLIKDFLNELGYFKAGIGDQRQVISFVGEVLDQGPTQKGLPATNLPCQHQGPLPRLDPIKKAMESFLMLRGGEIKMGVRNVVEGGPFEPPLLFVMQGLCPRSPFVYSRANPSSEKPLYQLGPKVSTNSEEK